MSYTGKTIRLRTIQPTATPATTRKIRVRIFSAIALALAIMGTGGMVFANNTNRYAYPSYPFQYTVRCGNGAGQGTLTFRNGGGWADAVCNSYVSGTPWFDGLTFQLYAGDRANVYPQNGRRMCNPAYSGQGQWTGRFFVC